VVVIECGYNFALILPKLSFLEYDGKNMKISKLPIVFLLTMFQSQAFSLEQSASVKVNTVLKAEASWDGKSIQYPAGEAEVTGMVIEIAPGGETGWHLHTVPSFAMVLEGELEVKLKDGALKRLRPGEALAEVVNTLHNGRNVGSTPVKLVVFYVGTKGAQLTVKEHVR
jgi:quercetin dioxygenase-like cupin family protein